MAEHKAGVGDLAGDDVRAELTGGRDSSIVGRDRPSRPAPRRDPRADPDDEAPSGRVDVVTMDRPSDRHSPSIDSVTNAALTLRRELAKLHQQAAAVERTIEDQRRERSEVLERIDFATSRAHELEQKLELAEGEVANVRRLHDAVLEDLQKVRGERDDLARAIDNAKSTADDLARARAEADALREAHNDALRAASRYETELAEIRKREQAGAQKVTDSEAELQSLRERLERMSAELTQSREEASQSKAEAVRLRQEAADASETIARAQAESERERTSARKELERLEKALAEARVAEEKLPVAFADLANSRVEAAEARSEMTRLERDLEAARHTRDVSIERATIAERETEDVRKDAERLQRELEGALIASAAATTRAITAERAKASVEDSVKQLRDEVTAAFARWRSLSPSTPPPADGSLAPPTRAVPSAEVAPRPASEAPPPVTRRGSTTSFPPVVAEAPPLSMPVESLPPTPLLDEDWVAESPAPRPPSVRPAPPPLPTNAASPASSSVPPPSRSAPPVPSARGSQRPPSMPPAVYPSLPPPAGSLPTAPPPSLRASERPAAAPALPKDRDALFELLADPSCARDAANELRDHPEWLRGRPPLELLMALSHLDYDVEAPVFELARGWDREPLCRALVAGLRDEPDPKLREHAAWLLKHLGAPGAWPSLAELVSNDSEPSAVRRWLLEAIERLVATQAIGWREVGDLVHLLVRHSDASLRDGVVGVVAALERSDEKRRVLLEVLRTDDDETVLASAVQALTTALPIALDPAVAERLLGHPSPRVQRSVVEFIERSKRAAKA